MDRKKVREIFPFQMMTYTNPNYSALNDQILFHLYFDEHVRSFKTEKYIIKKELHKIQLNCSHEVDQAVELFGKCSTAIEQN